MSNLHPSWPAARVTKLRNLARGGRSAAAIADRLNKDGGPPLTRNAVIGKAHRIGVQLGCAQ